jgi:hypothetical protein
MVREAYRPATADPDVVTSGFDDIVGLSSVVMMCQTTVLEAQPGARTRQAIALPINVDAELLGDGDLFVQGAPARAHEMIASLRKMKLPRTSAIYARSTDGAYGFFSWRMQPNIGQDEVFTWRTVLPATPSAASLTGRDVLPHGAAS